MLWLTALLVVPPLNIVSKRHGIVYGKIAMLLPPNFFGVRT